MESYHLTAKEFIFLCAVTGTEKVYGIEEAFQNSNEGDMQLELTKIHKDLVKKKYVRFDFDGNSTINKKLLTCIEVCAGCSQVFLLNAALDSRNQTITYYYKEGQAARLNQEEDGYSLSFIEIDQMQSELLDSLKVIQTQKNKKQIDLIMKQNQVKEFKETQNIKGFLSLTVIFTKQNHVESMMVLDTEKSILALTPEIINLENMIHVQSKEYSEVYDQMKRMLNVLE